VVKSLKGMDRLSDSLLNQLKRSPGFTNLPLPLLQDLRLVLSEGIANAFRHGSCGAKAPCRVSLAADPKKLQILIEDKGKGFNIAASMKNLPQEEALSGRGLWILKNLMDKVRYRRGRPNVLELTRKLSRPKNLDAAIELFDLLHHAIQQLKPKKALYEQFIEFITDLFNVERASFLLYDRDEKLLKVATSRGIAPRIAAKVRIAPGEGIAGFVFKSSRPMLVHHLSRMKKGEPKPRKKGYQSSSFVSVPVIASPFHIGEETIGVLNLTDKRDGTRFTEGELKLLNLMAGQAASAFRIRDLLDTVRSHEALNKEFEIVQEIQNRLLPTEFPALGDLDIGGACKLSNRGGGDYYDIVKVETRIRGVMADVSGHHVGSAITMASFRSIFRSLVYDPNTPGELLRVLRWAMHQDLVKLHQFISCWTFDYQSSGALRVSGAGHPPVFIFRAKSKKWEMVESKHIPLGLEDESEQHNVQLQLEKKDWLFLYTDGLFDPRMRATGFDKFRFFEFVETHSQLPAQEMVQKIIEEVAPHQMAIRSPDDVAILAFHRGR